MNSTKAYLIKISVYQVIYLLLHELPDIFPGPLGQLLGPSSESIYQHMKIGFFAMILLSVGEFILGRPHRGRSAHWLCTRAFSAVLLPLFMFVYFLVIPAFFVKIESLVVEILSANLVLIIASVSTFIFEHQFSQQRCSRGMCLVILLLFACSLSQFVIFNYRLPWFDIFAVPPGW